VSVSAGWCLSPDRSRFRLVFRTLVNGYFDAERTAAFVDHLMAALAAPVVLIWDNGGMHKGEPIRDLMRRHRGRLVVERLPPYAPMLDPVEQVWAWLKYGRLCNYAPATAAELSARAEAELDAIKENQAVLGGFFHATDIPLPRALLT
jgi:transposase